MTALKNFAISANGTHLGIYQAADADAAVLEYVRDAGYKTIDEAAFLNIDEKYELTPWEIDFRREGWLAELDVEEILETVTTGSIVALSTGADATRGRNTPHSIPTDRSSSR